MDMQELVEEKKHLEEELFVLLRRFENKTRTYVVNISYDSYKYGAFILKEGKCVLDVRMP